jgi:hypothetical protein
MSAKKLQNRLFGGKKEDRLDTAVSNRSGDASPSGELFGLDGWLWSAFEWCEMDPDE